MGPRVVVLLNLVPLDELVDDGEYADLVSELRDECAKYGAIASMKVPRPNDVTKALATSKANGGGGGGGGGGSDVEASAVGKCFIEYADAAGAANAAAHLRGRRFGDAMVEVDTAFDEELYRTGALR